MGTNKENGLREVRESRELQDGDKAHINLVIEGVVNGEVTNRMEDKADALFYSVNLEDGSGYSGAVGNVGIGSLIDAVTQIFISCMDAFQPHVTKDDVASIGAQIASNIVTASKNIIREM